MIADPEACDDYRDRLRQLQTTRSKLHWKDLDRRHRDRVVETIAAFGLDHLVIAATPLELRRQERARALCLERLAWELGTSHGVTQLVLEARPESLMRRDVRTIDTLRSKRAIPADLRVDHGLPREEPMLWIADQVLGALGASIVGEDRWYTAIRDSIEVVRIDV
ncbi:hypothetical protein [Homoserinibacter sp. YIM 151385]|uniref:hypothetical protein n=1 Tax=Homoserinibacter sp. YIM 151385 TaxID=2985506 RepID=UPI0022F0A3B2|nr:hypothetical protein [Homoserinibacter sp. YIM 151385]WBU37168.1 hypothetical protein OF852_09560 [Homoserinibacter sp. YIM 151385]